MKKKIQVVVLKPSRLLGQIGSIIEVARGYARNYLIPQKICTLATDRVIQAIESKKEHLKQEQLKVIAEYQKWLDKNPEIQLTYVADTNDTGKLFGSINKSDILNDLDKKHNLNLDFIHLNIDLPIKVIGTYSYELVLANEIVTNITVIVSRSDSHINNKKSL